MLESPKISKKQKQKRSSDESSSEEHNTGKKWTYRALCESTTCVPLKSIRLSKCKLGDRMLIRRSDFYMNKETGEPMKYKPM